MRRIRMTQAVLVGLTAVVGVLVGLATNVASDQQGRWPGPLRWVQDNPWWAMLVLVGIAVAVAILPEIRSHADRTETASDLTLAQVADQLTIAVQKQWQDEAQLRRLNDPYPLPVAWHPAGPDLVEPWEALRVTATGWPGGPPTDPGGWASSPAELAGADNDLADRLAQIPTGRLIVLGEPGAGKTMLLIRLVLDLLARRQTGDPVPVLVPLAGWNPVDQDLPTWLAARLTVDHPALAEPAPPGAGAVSRARALLDQRLLLPILDGLDELPEKAWSRAVTRLNDALIPRQGMVLASRTKAYQQAVTASAPVGGLPVRVWGAAGIILRSLEPDDVRAYLRRDAASQVAAARWDSILASLGTRGPVAQALTTPLLVGLARATYNPRPGEHTGMLPDPAELCDSGRFPTRAAIQEHLFDGFIPAAYRPHPDPASRCPWTADKAERWLMFLAQHLEGDRQGTSDLAWWELYRTIPKLLVGGVVGLAFGLTAGLLTGLWFGLLTGLLLGLLTGLLLGLLTGLLLGLLVGSEFGRSPARGLRWRWPPRETVAVALVSMLVAGLVAGLLFEFVAGLVAGLMVGLVTGLATGLVSMPASLTVAAEPQAVLARDRSTYWALTLVLGPVAGLMIGLGSGVAGGLVSGLVSGLVGGLAFGLGYPIMHTAWTPFVITRCRQALGRQLPWRLMSFLTDAHQKRGVLRQAGAVYQFRHIDLQRRLAIRSGPQIDAHHRKVGGSIRG